MSKKKETRGRPKKHKATEQHFVRFSYETEYEWVKRQLEVLKAIEENSRNVQLVIDALKKVKKKAKKKEPLRLA